MSDPCAAVLQINRCISRVESAEARVLRAEASMGKYADASSCFPLIWKDVALANAVSQLLQKLNACGEHLPRTKDKLTMFAVRRIFGQKLYVFDPRVLMEDLKEHSLIPANMADDALQHLSLVVSPPKAMCVPKADWPTDAQYLWRKALPPPETLGAKGLALWVCDRAAVYLKTPATEVVASLLATDELCKIDGEGRLQYDWERQTPPAALKHQTPWKMEKGIRSGDVTVKAALLIDLPQSNPAYQRVQQVRKDHDPAFERWMPHINIIYPFLDLDVLSASGLQRRLQASGQAAFDIELTSIGRFAFNDTCNFHFRPSKDSETKLQNLYNQLINVLPPSPTGNWLGAPSMKDDGKGKGEPKGKGKGKGKGKVMPKVKAKAKAKPEGSPPPGNEGFMAHMTVAKVEQSSSVDESTLEKLLLEPGGGVIRLRVSKISWCVRTDSTPFIEAAVLSLKEPTSELDLEAAKLDLEVAEQQLEIARQQLKRNVDLEPSNHNNDQGNEPSNHNYDQGNAAAEMDATVMDEGFNAKQCRKPGGGVDSRGEKNAGSLSDKEVRRERWWAAHRKEHRDRESVRKAREMLRRVQRDLKSQQTEQPTGTD